MSGESFTKEDNTTQRLLKHIERLIYDQSPSGNFPGALTDFGQFLEMRFGQGVFNQALQLLHNQLANDIGFQSMYAMSWQKPLYECAYLVEKEVDDTSLGLDDVICCKDAQLKLINYLVSKGKLNDFSMKDIALVKNEIIQKNETLVSDKCIKSSALLFMDRVEQKSIGLLGSVN
ncbi:hypothetical protein, partial [Facilibium subflavum]|uniref:hypothetical protein n=1 Tax=Facilibium subflavum TaxID=2219058 RepID=UPI0013C3329F